MKSTIWFVREPLLCATLTEIALSDYAANGGTAVGSWGGGPSTLAHGDKPKGTVGAYKWPSESVLFTGIMTAHDFIALQDITDGTSHTYMVGEKHVWPAEYDSAGPRDVGDDQGIYNSDERDTVRYALVVPRQDELTAGYNNETELYTWNFGSAHADGLNMGMCDGSVRKIEYDIDLTIHRRLANREDGELVD